MKALTRLRNRRQKNRGTDSVPMTPMIDVVFQLLIYFVLTFQIPDRISSMPVWQPRGDGGGGIRTTLGVQNGHYTWDGRRISLDRLENVFLQLADLNPEQMMIVVPTLDSRHEELVAVLNLINKAGLENVSLVSAK